LPNRSHILQGLVSAACIAAGFCAAQSPAANPAPAATPAVGDPPARVIHLSGATNSRAKQKKHYVVLVSLDGFRYDYPVKWGAPHIQEIASTGATAPDGMLPSYPSITFPNHVTLVTGLYPEHHGIVANTFYDPARGESYSYKNSKTNSDRHMAEAACSNTAAPDHALLQQHGPCGTQLWARLQ
jgi:hypothetical protein